MANTYKDSKYVKRIKLPKTKKRSRLTNPFDGSVRRTQEEHELKKHKRPKYKVDYRDEE